MQYICPRCGEPTEEKFCRRCTLESTKLLGCPDQIEFSLCSICGSRKTRGKWQIPDSITVEDIAYREVINALRIHKEFEEPEIEVDLSKRGATRYHAKVSIKGNFRGTGVKEICQITIRIRLVACDRCSRMAGRYFQSTVQVRANDSRNLSQTELEECKKISQSAANSGYISGDQLSFIQEIKEVKGGLDVVLGSTSLGRHLAKALLHRFGGRLQESCKLVGKKDGREVYRSTILIRLPRLKHGDIISFRDTLFEVIGFDSRKTLIVSLQGGRRSSISEESAEKVEVLGNKAKAQMALVISEDEKVLEILDPVTFKTFLASRPKDIIIEVGKEVRVIRTINGFIVLA